MTKFCFLTLMFLALSAGATEAPEVFSPAPDVKAIVITKANDLTWKVDYNGSKNKGNVSLDTEREIHIDVNDFDFSGHLGFSVWHVDDGMGTYTVFRVFTYSQPTNEFVERSPACGDEFVNLKIDKKRHYLISTYWDQNIPKTCITRLQK